MTIHTVRYDMMRAFFWVGGFLAFFNLAFHAYPLTCLEWPGKNIAFSSMELHDVLGILCVNFILLLFQAYLVKLFYRASFWRSFLMVFILHGVWTAYVLLAVMM